MVLGEGLCVNDHDKRILEFILSHGLVSVERLQLSFERRLCETLSLFDSSKHLIMLSRQDIMREANHFFIRSLESVRSPSHWHLYEKKDFPDCVSEASDLLALRN